MMKTQTLIVIIISVWLRPALSQDTIGSAILTNSAKFSKTVAIVKVLNYQYPRAWREKRFNTAMEVEVLDYLNSLDTKDTITVFGFGYSKDGAYIDDFKIGSTYLLCLDEADEVDFEGFYAKSSDYFISGKRVKWAEYDTLNNLVILENKNSFPLEEVTGFFQNNLKKRAAIFSEYQCRNLGDQLFVFDSIYNWYAVNNENNRLTMIGNFPNHRSIKRENIYYSICKDYDDIEQFDPYSLITEDFKVVQFPEGINYQMVLENGLLLVRDNEKHQGHYVQSVYNPFNGEFLLDWYDEIVELPENKLKITPIGGAEEIIDLPKLIK